METVKETVQVTVAVADLLTVKVLIRLRGSNGYGDGAGMVAGAGVVEVKGWGQVRDFNDYAEIYLKFIMFPKSQRCLDSYIRVIIS
ncbi:MAG: hypothetical protein IPJ45_13430 [Ignavibacteria bacterium]|nr:hypothetical protein [Ignavibacteria bacterium]